jgi:hypothetical protein
MRRIVLTFALSGFLFAGFSVQSTCRETLTEAGAQVVVGTWVNGSTNLRRALAYIFQDTYASRADMIATLERLLAVLQDSSKREWSATKLPASDGSDLYVGPGGFALLVNSAGEFFSIRGSEFLSSQLDETKWRRKIRPISVGALPLKKIGVARIETEP